MDLKYVLHYLAGYLFAYAYGMYNIHDKFSIVNKDIEFTTESSTTCLYLGNAYLNWFIFILII